MKHERAIPQDAALTAAFRGKSVLVTGAAGTVGRALIDRLVTFGCSRVVGLDNNESELFFLNEANARSGMFEPALCDVRELEDLTRIFRRVDVVFHAAALKHVPLCEQYPVEAVKTNIYGVQNVVQAARAAGVQRVLYTSSDKAVNPTNVMGTSKLMGEKLINAANLTAKDDGQVFSSTRFGNVLGSRGSVVPVFREQIRQGGPVRLTDSGMTRFIMTLDDAIDLVLKAGVLARGGEVFITKMAAIRIADLAQVLVEELAPKFGRDPKTIKIVESGRRPGEKICEELMNEEEVRRSIELEDYFAVLPALSDLYGENSQQYNGVVAKKVDHAYNSETAEKMSVEDLRTYVRAHRLAEIQELQ